MNPKISIFLSYRTKGECDVTICDELETQCDLRGFKLVYDASATKEGDNLITFMKDLTSARCVFLLLSPEYFQSAYTLFELVRINEQADQDCRLIFPVRSTDSMCTYVKTTSEQNWSENEPVRKELCRLLGGCTKDEAWQRVSKAWDAIIFPYLDELHQSLEGSAVDNALAKCLDNIDEALKTMVKISTEKLQEKIRTEITRLLKQQQILSQPLVAKLELAAGSDPGDIAKCIVEKKKSGEMLVILAQISSEQKKKLKFQNEQWNDYLYDVEQICGWILINSVDPDWFFQHELRLKQSSQKMGYSFALDYAPYIEVIISRSLLQSACYALDKHGDIKPASDRYNVQLFDAINKDATDIELLTPIFKDLRRDAKPPGDVDSLLTSIKRTARSLYKIREAKPIYYIVTSEYLAQLQGMDWFSNTEIELAGCLQFVCCDNKVKNYDGSPCQEEQGGLLEHLANILRLRK